MFNELQLRLEIVRPTMVALQLYSLEDEELLIGTCAQESKGGTYIKQINGIALGAWGMEPKTHDDIWKNWLPNQGPLCSRLINHCRVGVIEPPQAKYMAYHLYYACAMARLHYKRKNIPTPKDLEGQAAFWKEHYNTPQGKGTVEEYIHNYNLFVGNSKKPKGK
jgi:hypothetical protein